MAKELIYLQCGEVREKRDFLRNVHCLVHIPVNEKTTYNDLFDDLEKWASTPENLEAVKEWIDYNKKDYDDLSIFQTPVLDIIPDDGIKMFAIFDLRTV